MIAFEFTVHRVDDGSQEWVNFVPSPPGSAPGVYQFTPNQTYVLYPQLSTTKPFVISDVQPYLAKVRLPAYTHTFFSLQLAISRWHFDCELDLQLIFPVLLDLPGHRMQSWAIDTQI